jgi:hypothetical protein
MELKELSIKIPKEMLVYLAIDDDRTELQRNAMMLYPYIKNLTISHGRTAEILGISKWELITLYDNMGLAYLDQDISDIMADVRTYKMLKESIS